MPEGRCRGVRGCQYRLAITVAVWDVSSFVVVLWRRERERERERERSNARGAGVLELCGWKAGYCSEVTLEGHKVLAHQLREGGAREGAGGGAPCCARYTVTTVTVACRVLRA